MKLLKIYRAFHHFRFLSGGIFKLSKNVSARLSNLHFFRPDNIQMKNPFAKMCTLLFISRTLNRKNWTAAEIISEGASKLPFPCPEELFAKHSFPWKTYNFLVTFCFEPIKLPFSAKSLQQICQNCNIWCPRNTPRKKKSLKMLHFCFSFFRILSQKI